MTCVHTHDRWEVIEKASQLVMTLGITHVGVATDRDVHAAQGKERWPCRVYELWAGMYMLDPCEDVPMATHLPVSPVGY